MSEQTPLQIACDVVTHILDLTMPLSVPEMESLDAFGAVFKSLLSGDEKVCEVQLEMNASQNRLFLSLGIQFDLSPLKHGGQLRGILEKTVSPFLFGHHNAPGNFYLVKEPDGALIPCYDSILDYSPLDDEGIRDEFQIRFLRGLYMLELLSPVFAEIEKGRLPTAQERLKFLQVVQGLWEVYQITPDVPLHGVRLPPGMYGGKTTFLTQ